ncbi:hypothetical protein TH61_08925 [Rufibacter sp. DG15C]|nr:hypothetical protein TH61_08925 [Rufibacter sp. DG15C]
MILFQDHLIVLYYEPKTDILSVDWPSVEAYNLLEIERAVTLLVEYIRNYDVMRLLIDRSHSKMAPEVDMTAYMEIVTRFGASLQATRLKKSASIVIVHKDKARVIR